MNSYNVPTNDTASRKQGVIANEMGHSFGLDDNNSQTGVVMCQEKFGRAVSASTADDLAGINYLYH